MSKPTVLHIGEPIKYNKSYFDDVFRSHFNVVRNDCLDRESFKKALSSNKFGSFVAIFRPFWNSGGEMGMWDKELISLLPSSVRIFASAGAGYNWADVNEFAKHGIMYCNGVTCSDEAVTDLMIWHLLSVCRMTAWSQSAAKSCNADKFNKAHDGVPPISHNVSVFSLGIVGLGSIGKLACQRIRKCFDMDLHYHDVVRAESSFESNWRVKYHKSLHDMLGQVDIVIVSVPYDESTHHLMGEKEFQAMRKDSRLINTSRGRTVDEKALIGALKSGKLAAAGLDVFYDEPNINPELANMRNVSMTSHNGGGTIETWIRFEKLAMENIVSFWSKGKPVNAPVNAKTLASIGAPKL